MTSEERSEIQSVTRAAQILALFSADSPELSAQQVAARLGFNRTTAYRYCTSMVSAGLLARGSESSSFVPGGLVLQIGAFALGRRRVMEVSQPHMRDLANESSKTVVLSLWGAAGPVVARVEEASSSAVLVTVRVGTALHLDAAQAILFAAFHPDQLMIERLVNTRGPKEAVTLWAQITAARSAGFCTSSKTPGIVAVAAPISDEFGICASIAVVYADNRASMSADDPTVTQVVNVARAITKEMGGRYLPDPR